MIVDSLDYIIFMKYGVHASESIDSIIYRKQNEVKKTGYMLWGYGGTLCHPLSQIKQFLDKIGPEKKLFLLLSETKSEHHSSGKRQNQMSFDGKTWVPIPSGNEVIGSKYAVKCINFSRVNFDIDLTEYQVAVGPSSGKKLSEYVRGRVDKACGRAISNTTHDEVTLKPVHISLMAEITDAVFVKE